MKITGREIRGLLIDLDGVLYVGGTHLPGAGEFVEAIQRASVPHCFLTNTTTKSVAALRSKLYKLGIPASSGEILSATEAVKTYLAEMNYHRCFLLLNDDVLGDFTHIDNTARDPQAVVIGDIGNAWSYDLLNRVFRAVMNGAELIGLHRNKFWQTSAGLQMDIGGFIAGLEYITGKTATIIGKPEKAFFDAALSRIRLTVDEVAMIGDDVDTDIGAAQKLGMTGVLVKTGKFREDYFNASEIKPDLIVDSIQDLVGFVST